MPIQSGATPDDLRQDLLKSKLGGLLRWRVPEVAHTVGPYNLSVFEGYDAARRAVIQKCERRLQEYSDQDLVVLAQGKNAERHAIHDEWRQFLAVDIGRLKQRPPPWYAAGFGHPDHTADFDFWCKMPRLSLEEALALSVGVRPESLSKTFISPMTRKPPDSLDTPLDFLMHRYELLKRQFDPQNSDWSVKPKSFLDWARRVHFEASPEFIRKLALFHEGGEPRPVASEGARKPDQREIDKIAQLFTAMAIDQLGYDPNSKRSPIPKEIVDIGASMGLKVSEDTVRKYLRLGQSFIPDEWKPR